jgi:hypothetical protein
MLKTFAILLGALLLLPSLAACGGDDDDGGGNSPFGNNDTGGGGTTPGSISNLKGKGECEVKVTGDVQTSWKADGGADAVGSDYWLSDDDLRKALEFLASGSGDAKKKEVDEMMKRDPRFFILLLNCIPSDSTKGSLTLSPSNEAKYADVPYKAGEYVIGKGGVLGGTDDPKAFGALFATDDETLWQVSEDGTLKITKWNSDGIAGSFNFKAEEGFVTSGTPKKVSVEGTFDFGCPSGNCKK